MNALFSPTVLSYRQECKKLREELKEEHEEDKTTALTQLAQSKEQELSSARESWQRKVEDLLEQVWLTHNVSLNMEKQKTLLTSPRCRTHLVELFTG